jgi:hypothetical protein
MREGCGEFLDRINRIRQDFYECCFRGEFCKRVFGQD